MYQAKLPTIVLKNNNSKKWTKNWAKKIFLIVIE